MNRWIKIGTIVLFLAVIVAGSFFIFRKKRTKIENIAAIENTSSIQQQENEKPRETEDTSDSSTNPAPETIKNSAIDGEKQEIKAEESQEKTTNKTKSDLVSWGYKSANSRKIDTIILHSSYNALTSDPYDFSKLLEEYKSYGVAPHYVIDRDGNIHQLVAEKNIAYHAGVSQTPDSRSDVNIFSIGIEIVNRESDKINSVQYRAINSLISEIKKTYEIKYVLGHNQIAPGRKTDPWNLDWSKIKK